MQFSEFDLDERLKAPLTAQGIVEPTPIQAEAIPVALAGGDLIGLAQTGTGKTLAFTLPSLTKIVREFPPEQQPAPEAEAPPKEQKRGRRAKSAGSAAASNAPREIMLVLTPTRELAVQVHRVVEPLAEAVGLSSMVVYGGVSLEHQSEKMRKGRTVIVGTPGRLLDHMQRGNLRFRNLRLLVMDEADRMLDMGFLPDIRRILSKLPRDRQTMMFSATFPSEISHLATEFMNNPQTVRVGSVFKPVDAVRQWIYPVNPHDKEGLLLHLMESEKVDSALVFCRTKRRTEQLTRALRRKNLSVAQIHGDRSQSQRESALAAFRDGRIKILIATDVAARGLDISGISHVVNFDIPVNPDDYIHRIGRTARAKAEGDAVTFVSPTEWKELEAVERQLGRNIPRKEWERAPELLSMFSEKKAEAKVEEPQRRQKGRTHLQGQAVRFGRGRRR